MAKTVEVKAHIEVPRVPNFLHTTDGQLLDVAAVTENGLREIGALWTEELVEHARRRALLEPMMRET